MSIVSKSNTLVSGTGGEQIQLGAPNISPPSNITLVAAGDNVINNCNAVNVKIKTGTGNNTVIAGEGSRKNFIETGAGNDTVKIWTGDETTIKFGAGSNQVNICADTKILLDTGSSDNYSVEYFNGAGADITLTDGKGNYTVRGTSGENIFDYTIPGSNMVIEAYGGEDLIRVRAPFGTAKVSGDDVYIPIATGGSIVVKNARAHKLNINGKSIIVGSYASGYTPLQVIHRFMAALNRTKLRGIAAVDEAVRKSSKFGDVDEVIACMINDCKRLRDADKFLRDCCGIVYDNADTGSITGWSAGGNIVKTKDSIVDEVGRVKIFRGREFTVDGLNVIVPNNLRGVQQDIVNGLYTWWIKNTLDLIVESYGLVYSFQNPRATVRKINVEFYNEDDHWLASVNHAYSTATGKASALTLRINMKYYAEMNAADPNGSSAYSRNDERATYLDRTMAHEFTHAVMAANIPYFHELPAWLKEGTAEMTHGIADERKSDLKILAGDPNKLYNALKNPTADASQVVISGVYSPVYAGGFILLHYFAKKVAHMR